MFASEKVMLEYLGDLLSEVPEDAKAEQISKAVAANKAPNVTNEAPNIEQKQHEVNPSYISESAVSTTPVPQPQVEPKLRPIKSQAREFKEYEEEVASISEPSAVEKLLQQVKLKQQEAIKIQF